MQTIAFVLAGIVVAALLALTLLRLSDTAAERRAWTGIAAVAEVSPDRFDPAMVADLPDAARRYFLYAIAPGTPLAPAARIDMGGEIGLGPKDAPGYRPMEARQILSPRAGFVWRLGSGAIGGSDAMAEGRSWTRFRLAGLVPVVRAGGPDHFRSSFGRAVSEAAIWTPAALLPGPGIAWEDAGPDIARVTVTAHGLSQSVDIAVAPDGRPVSVLIERWSNANPEAAWRLQPFGGTLGGFRTFGGYRLATEVDGGNHFGTEAYFPFFKARATDISVADLSW